MATIESAFGAMVRLPERLTAERDVQHESLTTYLEDPLRLYVATRLLRGVLFATAAVLLARLTGVATPQAVGVLLLAIILFVVVCEQLVPSALVRRDASRVLALLLPSFDYGLRVLAPLTAGLLRLARPPRARPRVGPTASGRSSRLGPVTGRSTPRPSRTRPRSASCCGPSLDFGGSGWDR